MNGNFISERERESEKEERVRERIGGERMNE